MAALKLDKLAKQHIRIAHRERQAAELKAQSDKGIATLIAAAKARIHAEWADKQDDMTILAKYGRAKPIKGANIRVHNPETGRWDITFGVQFDAGLMMPADAYGEYTYWSGHFSAEDSCYQDLLHLHWLRCNYERQQAEERDALEVEFRKTGSVAKLAQAVPWILEIPYFAQRLAA